MSNNSFRLFLSSNASTEYASNAPSHFKTLLDNPIELQGSWKVALENMSYSSHLKTKPDTMMLNAISKHENTQLKNHPYHYRVDENGEWLGRAGVQPPSFPTPLENIESLINVLNALNDVILVDGDKRKLFGDVFKFSLREGRVHLQIFDANFILRITNGLARVLGFDYYEIFSASNDWTAPNNYGDVSGVTADCCLMRYFNHSLQAFERRLVIKEKQRRVKSKQQFLVLWKQRVTPYFDVTARFINNRLVIDSTFDTKLSFMNSNDFYNTLGVYKVYMWCNQWARLEVNFSKNNYNEEWSIDVYSTRLAFNSNVKKQMLELTLYPLQCKTHAEAMLRINRKVNAQLKRVLKADYDEKQHAFQLSIINKRACLTLGPRLEAVLGDKVKSLFSFYHADIKRNQTFGNKDLENDFEHKEDISLVCSLSHDTKPLCRFSHLRSDDTTSTLQMSKRRFYPLKENVFDSIQCELQDAKRNRLDITERPTVLTLLCEKCNTVTDAK